jgi:hypothetical protein
MSSLKTGSINDTSATSTPAASVSSTPPDSPSRRRISTPLFFADATLDLEEAHDIAETPEITHRKTPHILSSSAPSLPLQLPSLLNQINNNNNSSHLRSTYDSSTRRPMRSIQHTSATSRPYKSINGGSAPPPTIPETPEDDPTTATNSSSDRDAPRIMSSITSLEIDLQPHMPHTLPRWPRDVPWATAFCCLVPPTLLAPLWWYPWVATSHATHVSWLLAGISAWMLSHALYLIPAGGDGDAQRHFVARALVLGAPVVVALEVAVVVLVLGTLPTTPWAALIPAWGLMHDVLLFRRWKRPAPGSVATQASSRQALFQALCDLALDVLSRSLRRMSLVRTLIFLLSIQWGLLYLWQTLLVMVWNARHSYSRVLLVLVAGKWATGIVTRLLTYMASGGVAHWLLLQQQSQSRNLQSSPSQDDNSVNGDNGNDDDDSYASNGNAKSSIPAAYRTADASIYRSVAGLEDVLDDDDDIDDEAQDSTPYTRRSSVTHPSTAETRPLTTVKALLASGLTISFGAVAQCGLLGGLAQWVWSQLRTFTVATPQFQGMAIGAVEPTWRERLWYPVRRWARIFVQNHNDMGMAHVALYFKSYSRAARDVMQRIEDSGTYHNMFCMTSWCCCMQIFCLSFLRSYRSGTHPARRYYDAHVRMRMRSTVRCSSVVHWHLACSSSNHWSRR